MPIEIDILTESLSQHPLFQESLRLVRQNADGGRVWAIGGMVYRTIVQGLYGVEFSACDFDFIVENQKPFADIELPAGWDLGKTPLYSPRFVNGPWQIDAVPIWNIRRPSSPSYFSSMTPDEKVIHYCELVPLTVQAIAYDLENRVLIGDTALAAIHSRTVGVQSIEDLIESARFTGITPREYLEKKAKSLGFTPDYANVL